MNKVITASLLIIALSACKTGKKGPNVSDIKVSTTIERFDQDLFKVDSNNLEEGLTKLAKAHPAFYADYMRYILGVSGFVKDTDTHNAVREFLRNYTVVYDSLKNQFTNTKAIETEIEDGFKHVKYYFPKYTLGKVSFFVGPFDAPGVAVVRSGVAVGLQQFAGKDFFAYQTQGIQEMYPSYISRRFQPQYIPANCMKAIAEDLFPDRSPGLPLIQQMIEKGKNWYLLDLFLPNSPDSLKTGYTAAQLDWCNENEGLIWSYLAKNEDLNSLSPVVINTYIGESPFTQNMSQEYSPGNIGAWVGWQIVKKYAEKFPNLKPEEIMHTDPAVILEKAKYKPR
jgi:hypothetical protein